MDLQLAKEALQRYFGYDDFRPMQAEIIQKIYEGRDNLILMPTGGGKSICFQIPALTMAGACIVVSPLISLMKDQVEGLRANGVKAAFLNSSLARGEQQRVEDDFYCGRLHILYVSPEKLASQQLLPLLKRSRISLFAIDEAHCISAWGHDFRPEYGRMKFLKREFPHVPVTALTATADKLTRRDIIRQLGLREPAVFIASFDRPNLSLSVQPGQNRTKQLLRFIRDRQHQAGIVYCLSRKSTERVAEQLREQGLRADHYHAGMSAEARSRVQENFLKDNTLIVCATIAFGMGIDKSNVRWIIHYNLPKNLESYYQEIGRAGRDGAPAAALLFYNLNDVNLLSDIIRQSESKQAELQLAKLDRMRQYAESLACRRRILLNYFGENLQENCGNCDVCHNPPQYFDGTLIAQKALSAVYRLRQSVGLQSLIDVLRGANKREIRERGYDQIKTYGAGRDLSVGDWRYYLMQLLNLGYLEIAHHQKNTLHLTPASRAILFEGKKVELVQASTLKKRREGTSKRRQQYREGLSATDQLFEKLRQLRKRLAQERGIPPYHIFSDATLQEMCKNRPLDDEAMKRISGVGDRKLHLYGSLFIEAIREFLYQDLSPPR